MRISDWSSDVCSSDLQALCQRAQVVNGDGVVLGGEQLAWGAPGEGGALQHGLCRLRPDEGERGAQREGCGERAVGDRQGDGRSEEHTSELQSLMRISYAVFCLKKKKTQLICHVYTRHK